MAAMLSSGCSPSPQVGHSIARTRPEELIDGFQIPSRRVTMASIPHRSHVICITSIELSPPLLAIRDGITAFQFITPAAAVPTSSLRFRASKNRLPLPGFTYQVHRGATKFVPAKKDRLQRRVKTFLAIMLEIIVAGKINQLGGADDTRAEYSHCPPQ